MIIWNTLRDELRYLDSIYIKSSINNQNNDKINDDNMQNVAALKLFYINNVQSKFQQRFRIFMYMGSRFIYKIPLHQRFIYYT